jgi:anthranilate 1,2-dioxygenase ferredoxin reductase subunit
MLSDTYVIVGAGHAARRAAETLRERAPNIRIVMIGEENELPYDRPVLSKDALLGEDGERRAFIRDAGWYRDQRIELRLGVRVERIDRSTNCVILGDGVRIEYCCLLLATGSRVRRFAGPVDTAVEIHYVRTISDARALREVLVPGARVAVLGGGFIGLEAAASARTRGCAVTLIEPADGLLQRSMPAEVGAFVLDLHRRHGIDIRLRTTPVAIETSVHRGASVVTVCAGVRSEIDADVVIVGIGVIPNVDLAVSAGLQVVNGIVVDQHCRTADAAIFAAGEVTNHFNPLLGGHMRVESWQVAENQPAVAAANMLGSNAVYEELPWLWSDQHDCNIQTLGVFATHQTRLVRGEPAQGSFCVLALGLDGILEAAVAVNCGREMAVFRRLIRDKKFIPDSQLRDPDVKLKVFLK